LVHKKTGRLHLYWAANVDIHRGVWPQAKILAVLALTSVFSFCFYTIISMSAFAHEGQAPAQATAHLATQTFWPDSSGLPAFDALRLLLLASPDASRALPPVWETSPPLGGLGVGGCEGQTSLRLDLSGAIIGTSGWLPGQFPPDPLEYRPWLDKESRLRWRQKTGITVTLPGGWTLAEWVLIDSDRALDPTNRAKEYRQLDATVDVPLAFVRYEKGAFRFQLGRGWRRWGPGWTGSLILDDHHPPADGFEACYTAGRWSARYSFDRLDNWYPAPPALPESPAEPELSRYLAAHRVDIQPHDRLRLGISETAVVAADGTPPFWALNPLLPFALMQQERDPVEEVANVLWALDAVWNPGPEWALYGQFLLDDYMLDSEDRDTYPDQLGWLAGVLWQNGAGKSEGYAVPGYGLGAGLEYSRLSTWTYVHRDRPGRYRAWDATLGHPAGPDSETLSGFCEWRERHSGRRLLGSWHRHGRVDINTPETSTGHVDEPFPSRPTVTRWQLAAIATMPGPLGSELEWRLGWSEASAQGASQDLPAVSEADLDSRTYASLTVRVPLWTWQTMGF
jgi:hypothetical protein